LTISLKTNGYLCIGDLKSENRTFHDDNSNVRHFGFDKIKLNNILRNIGFGDIQNEEYFIVKKPDRTGLIQEYPMFFMYAKKI